MQIPHLTVPNLAAALFICGLVAPVARAQGQAGLAPVAAPGVAPFTQRAEDDKVLDWARRWADENLDEPAERFAMLSYAVSAAERREVLARPVPGTDNSYSSGGSFRTAFTHLRRVTFLVELRSAPPVGGSPASQPDWNARHLCNGTLVAPNWVLTSAACVPADGNSHAIEARTGVQDLSQDAGRTRRVIRIERNAQAGLAMLELDSSTSGAGGANVSPATALTPMAPSQAEVEFLGLGFGRVMRPGWPVVLYRHFALAPRDTTSHGAGDVDSFAMQGNRAPAEPSLTGSGLRLCAGDNGSPIYVYDLEAGPLLAGVLNVLPGEPRGCFETPATKSGNPTPQAPVIAVTKWASWMAAVTGVSLAVVEPRQLPGIAGYAF
ncbi:MAG: hypothetical protein NVS3B27_01100 [Novosphingobium sp.]